MSERAYMGAAITTDNYGIRDNNVLSDHVHGLDNGDEIVIETPVRQIAFPNINTQEVDGRTFRSDTDNIDSQEVDGRSKTSRHGERKLSQSSAPSIRKIQLDYIDIVVETLNEN